MRGSNKHGSLMSACVAQPMRLEFLPSVKTVDDNHCGLETSPIHTVQPEFQCVG